MFHCRVKCRSMLSVFCGHSRRCGFVTAYWSTTPAVQWPMAVSSQYLFAMLYFTFVCLCTERVFSLPLPATCQIQAEQLLFFFSKPAQIDKIMKMYVFLSNSGQLLTLEYPPPSPRESHLSAGAWGCPQPRGAAGGHPAGDEPPPGPRPVPALHPRQRLAPVCLSPPRAPILAMAGL